ncbi:MAG: tagatose-6-phosphate ketose isomerase [Acidobacteria bacterium]|nr:tagatose-6-phosphate ketose isomerase [Acidobacteriota bacterium]MBW4045807.1 tagatose-6-phosphate ketose isomerase [Acidobacteriota bacterium]
MTSLSNLLALPLAEKTARGLLHTPQEIAQQPKTWRGTLARFDHYVASLREFLTQAGLQTAVEQRPTVLLIGAGTSDYISRVLTILLRQKWGCEVMAVASTDLLANLEDYVVEGRRYLWISFSRSGDSPEGVAVLEQALRKYPQIAQLIVTCNPRSRMAEVSRASGRAFVAVLEDEVNDRGLAMTSSFTNMVIFGQCLAHAWEIEKYRPTLEQLARAAESFLAAASERASVLAKSGFSRICFVGSGSFAGLAKESALKVLEMSAGQIKTMSETVLGLRHGPMAALDRETLFVCFVSSDWRRQQYEMDLLREIEAKGIVASRLAIGPKAAESAVAPLCDNYLAIDAEVADLYRAPVDVIFGQLLGLYCSIEHGMKPDAPSPDGVISRVVQSFQIYSEIAR